jgi:hypothetical protein
MIKLLFRIGMLNVLLLLTGFLYFGFKPVTTIVLQEPKSTLTPVEFYAAAVKDERNDKNEIGRLLPVGGGEAPVAIDLEGGFLPSVNTFIDHGLSKNTSLRPVVISLKKFMVTETPLPGDLAKGRIVVVMSFGLQAADTIKHLIDFNGSAFYERPPGPPQQIEPKLRHLLESGLAYFNTWINGQAGTNMILAKTVALSFSDHPGTTAGDTVYYSAKRPLTWDDFKSKVPSAKFDAEVYPGFGYNERTTVKDAVINLELEISVSVLKSACWVRSGGMNDYELNHEQRHFDIAKIAAERFKRRIKSEALPVNNYDGSINVDYLDAYREMDSLQMAYDKETRHGADRYVQGEWNKKIDEELRSGSGSK